MGWLVAGFVHPERVDLPSRHHLRPIRASDVEIDYPVVMGSQGRLWEKYGATWGWPPADMTLEADREDLVHHEREIEAHEAFNYAILNEDESELLGCVYIDPPGADSGGADALISWWVVDDEVDRELDRTLERFVPGWLADTWGFRSVRYSP
jgi:hypothetical protein